VTDFLTAIGLALAIEGALYGLFPNAMRRMVARMLTEPAESIRFGALAMACLGVAIVWLARS
jgi:uncharacterized protein YjeT (DUF2065 family)